MKRTIQKEEIRITFNETEELKQAVYDRALKFYLDMESFCGESIMQSDDPQIEAPITMSDIADDLFKFDVEYIEDEEPKKAKAISKGAKGPLGL